MNQIVPQLWMLVPKEERDLLAEVFNLTRTGTTEIIDQTVVTDGYRDTDLLGITLQKMCEFVGSEESFMRAWELTQMKAHSILNPPQHFIGSAEQLKKLQEGAEFPLKEVSNEEFERLQKVEAEKLAKKAKKDAEKLAKENEKKIKENQNV